MLKILIKVLTNDGTEPDYFPAGNYGDAVIPILLKQTHEFQKTLKRSQDKLNMLTGVLVVSKKNKKKRRNYFAF